MDLSRRGFLWLAVLALVAAQALGLMHRVVHGPQGEIGHTLMAKQDHAHQADDCEHGHGWLAGLFAGHDDDSTCRLFDPLQHDGAPGVAALVLPVLLTSFFLASSQGDFVARWAALYNARAPPTLR